MADPIDRSLAAILSADVVGYSRLMAEDEAGAVMEKNAEGKMAVTRVTLRPRVRFGGERQPSFEEIARA